MTATRRGRGRVRGQGRGRGRTCTVESSSSASLVANVPSQTKLSSSPRDDDSRPALRKNKAIQLTPSSTPTKSEPQPTAESSVVLATPLKTLKLVDATILLRGNKMTKRPDSLGTLSLEQWKAWARAHEWLASSPSTAIASGSSEIRSREQTIQHSSRPSQETECMSTLSSVVASFAEEERLLFDLLIVSSWAVDDSTPTGQTNKHLYPLYRIVVNSNKLSLEVLSSPTKNGATGSRMEVLSERYLRSRAFFRLMHAVSNDGNNGNGNGNGNRNASVEEKPCVVWWNHALKVAQLIRANKIHVEKQSQPAASNQRNASASSFVNSIITKKAVSTDIVHHADSNPNDTAKNMSIEERVRARAALREFNNAMHRAKSTATKSGSTNDKKALLELADALRYFSQRRCVSSRANSGTALDRLRSRVADGGPSAVDGVDRVVSARLSVTDFLNDARLCWNAVLRNSTGSGSSKGGGGGSFAHGADSRGMSTSSAVNVDLSRVLFLLRLNTTYDSDNARKNAAKPADEIASHRRRMEKYLLGLLRELTTVVSDWICVTRIPSVLSSSSAKRKDSASSVNGASANGAEVAKSVITRDSIIIIRNDTVDYNKDVRVKLGGRAAAADNGSRKRTVEGNPKGQQPTAATKLRGKSHALGPSVVADAIVPPSFRQKYGKVIESTCVRAATETKKTEYRSA